MAEGYREEAFAGLLNPLKEMPCSTPEERKQRLDDFRKHPLHDRLIMELLQALKPEAYKSLLNPQPDQARAASAIASASTSRREVDTEVFMEAVNEAVQRYTGRKKDETEYSFISSVKLNYQQHAGRAAGVHDYQNAQVMLPKIPERNMSEVLKLVKDIRQLKENFGSQMSTEVLLDKILKNADNSRICTGQMREAVINIVDNLYAKVSMDMAVDEEEEHDLSEILGREDPGFQEVEDEHAFRQLLEMILKYLEESWSLVEAGTDKQTRDLFRAFFTKEILILLKLRYAGEKVGGQAEPNCRQWCPRRNRCRIRRDGCYVRYKTEPAGNEEIYELLKPSGEKLCQRIFQKKYLECAVGKKNEQLSQIYQTVLKEDFRFTDAILGAALNREKTQISKGRKKYNTYMEGLYRFLLNQNGQMG